MADGEKHPIRNLIVFPVIAGLILAGLLYFIPKLLAFVLSTISTIWNYLLSRTFLPNSLLCLLVVLAIPTVLNLTRYFFRNKIQKASNEPSIKSYTTDNIFGMTWKWSFITEHNMPSQNLWCFCPNCSNRLVHSSSYDNHMRLTTIFSCENCNFHSNSFRGDRDDVLGTVRRAVERKVTTGEWKNIIEGSSQPDSNPQ